MNKTWKQRGREQMASKGMWRELKVKKLHPDAVLPTRGTSGSGGLDLYSTEDVELWPGDIKGIHLGIAIEIPVGYFGLLMTRSSFGIKGVRLSSGANCVDADYRGEVMVFLRNDGNYPFTVKKGDGVAQIVIAPYLSLDPAWADELTKTQRGDGGFGSTGR